jgi:hypothetical protein
MVVLGVVGGGWLLSRPFDQEKNSDDVGFCLRGESKSTLYNLLEYP